MQGYTKMEKTALLPSSIPTIKSVPKRIVMVSLSLFVSASIFTFSFPVYRKQLQD